MHRRRSAVGSSGVDPASPEASLTASSVEEIPQTPSSFSGFISPSRSAQVSRSDSAQVNLTEQQVKEWTGLQRRYRDRSLMPAGLMNLRNSCYLNAVLQTLFQIPALTDWVFFTYAAGLQTAPCRRPYFGDGMCRGKCFICRLAHVGLDLFTRKAPVSPKPVYEFLINETSRLQPGRQEDAHDLLDLFRTNFIKEMTLLDPEAPNLIEQWFGFTIAMTKTCVSCKHVSTAKQDFHHELILDIHQDYVTSIVQAFEVIFNPMTMTNKVCGHCRSVTNIKWAETITEMPPYLWVVLNRFDAGGKNMRRLQMSNFIEFPTTNETHEKQVIHYRLKAVIYHRGTTVQNGHYFAVIRCPDERRLHKFNDASAPQRVETWQLVNDSDATPYLLVFEKVPERPHLDVANGPVVELSYEIIALLRASAAQWQIFPKSDQKISLAKLTKYYEWLQKSYQGPGADFSVLNVTVRRIADISVLIGKAEADANNSHEAGKLIQERNELLNGVRSYLVKFAPTSRMMPRALTEVDKIQLGNALVLHFFSGSQKCFNMKTFKDKDEMRKVVEMVSTFKIEDENKRAKWAVFLADTARRTTSHFHKFLQILVKNHRCQDCESSRCM